MARTFCPVRQCGWDYQDKTTSYKQADAAQIEHMRSKHARWLDTRKSRAYDRGIIDDPFARLTADQVILVGFHYSNT